MKVTANPGQDKGGSCLGDSGGPVLKAGSNVILGLNSFGANANCAGVNYATRVDTPEVLDWIRASLKKAK
jgi:secreted trypsin-like serine protease